MSALAEILQVIGKSGVLDSGAAFRRFQRSLPPPLHQRIASRLRDRSDRTPKPEVMFRDMIKAGEVKIVRRRFRAPLLVTIKKQRGR